MMQERMYLGKLCIGMQIILTWEAPLPQSPISYIPDCVAANKSAADDAAIE